MDRSVVSRQREAEHGYSQRYAHRNRNACITKKVIVPGALDNGEAGNFPANGGKFPQQKFAASA